MEWGGVDQAMWQPFVLTLITLPLYVPTLSFGISAASAGPGRGL